MSRATNSAPNNQWSKTTALANREKYVPYSPLKSWLFTIMRNTFCTRIRIQKREAPGLSECVSPIASVKASQELTLEAYDVQTAMETLFWHW